MNESKLISAGFSPGFLKPAGDLSHLRLIDPQAVRDLADSINDLKSAEIDSRQITVVLGTGGTLAMKTDNGIRVPDISFERVMNDADHRLLEKFLPMGLQAFNLDSSQMNYSHTRELCVVMTYLWQYITVPFMGFLILHGTDTMSFNAAATSLMLGQGLPFSVVYTGSQRPMRDPLSDAPANIRNAFYTLESLQANNMAEVVIAMGDRALLGTSAEKVDDMLANAYDAPRHCYVAHFDRLEYPIRLASWLKPRRSVPFEPTIWPSDYSHTLVIHSMLGLDPGIIAQQAAMSSVRAIILYSYGAGTIDEDILNATVPPALARGIPVFVVNSVHSDYRVEYLSSFKAIQMGVIPLDMTLASALAKIEIALCHYAGDVKAIAAFMTGNYVGEIPTEESRFASK